ncbi:MAG: PAS domain S-box protein [Bdellovibrionaceae bacterium]|nr:PAS domain S-box protein [Pseudobdellovibrionaceae bacterium]
MINQSLDIQASYQIIQLIERSKENSETIIENLPDIFLVIDGRGRVFKANKESCQFFGLIAEQVIGYSFSSHIEPEEWNLIKGHLVSLDRDKIVASFEMPIVVRGSEKIFLWTLSKFGDFREKGLVLYSLQGRDITLLRVYQKKINDIFSSIPLGIFTVNSLGRIEDAFSDYTRFMLGRSDIAGKTLQEVLFEPAKESMDVAGREGFKSMMGAMNRPLRDFDILADTFPKQIYYPLPHSISEKGRYLGLKVQSIAWGDQVVGLLIIIEDRTLIVEAEKADEKGQLLQDQSIERALQLKRADPEILEVVLTDLERLFTELGDCVLTQTSDGLKNVLHSIKSNARLAGFANLQKISHSFESKLRESEKFSWEVVYTNIDGLLSEYREIVGLDRILNSTKKTKAPQFLENMNRSPWRLYREAEHSPSMKADFEKFLMTISMTSLAQIEPAIMGMVSTVSSKTGKKARVIFSWDRDHQIDIDLVSDIRICLGHLVTNAMDHGIETPTVRVSKGKGANGLLHIGSILSKDGFILFIEDDGEGLNSAKIREKALKQNLLSEEEAKYLSEGEINDFIFASGFSTKPVASDVSGRGVGLSAVREICIKNGGNCKVSTNGQGVTRFELHFRF